MFSFRNRRPDLVRKIAILLLIACPFFQGCNFNEDVLTKVGGFLQKTLFNSKLSDTEKEATFKSTFSDKNLQNLVIAQVFGVNAYYISPEQQAAFFSDINSFSWSILAAAMAPGSLSGANLATVELIAQNRGIQLTDDQITLLNSLSAYGSTVNQWVVSQSQTYVDSRLGSVASHLPYAGLNVYSSLGIDDATAIASIRNVIWNDDSFNAAMLAPTSDPNANQNIVTEVLDWVGSYINSTTNAIASPPGRPPS